MNYSDHAINVLAAKTFKGIGRAWVVKNMGEPLAVDAVVSLLNEDSKEGRQITPGEFERVKESIKHSVGELEGFADGIVAVGDENFPVCRGRVKNGERPVALFYRGELGLLGPDNRNVAVIGLLNPDAATEEAEQAIVAELVERGATIVSGLALGCDTVAHRQALQSNGKTIAVLPSPLNDILPKANAGLAHEIVESGGLLITEYYQSATSKGELKGRYQERDRLQALFSDSVILSASYAKNDQGNDSGSRLAMGYAESYSIPRAVIYDPSTDTDNPKHDLNRQLIAEQKEIAVINRGNLNLMVRQILSNGASVATPQPHQQGIFDAV